MLLSLVFLVAGAGCTTTKSTTKGGIYDLDDNTAYVQGKAVRINDDYIVVKYSPKKQVRLETSNDMTLEGFQSLRAIRMMDPVKISYRVEGNRNRIISIASMADLDCCK